MDQVIAIRRVYLGESRSLKAPYAELTLDVLEDVESGEVSDRGLRVVAFGEAVVRTLTNWLAADEVGTELSPPLVLRVAREGNVHVLLDVEAPADDVPAL
ncbi:MAG: hypothetical protein O2816_05070 [Planctomycetota bacterium]|nr:hypothetical protein [Planctomycetota bacterium]